MKTPYFAFYPQDWLADNKVMMMTHEEKGVYIELLCHMWNFQDSECSLPDNDKLICHLLRISPAKWKKLKSKFFDENFAVFSKENGKIFNKRLKKEFEIAKEKSLKASESAKKKWEAKQRNSLNNKDEDNANAEETHMQPYCEGSADAEQTQMQSQCDRYANQNHNQNQNINKTNTRPVLQTERVEVVERNSYRADAKAILEFLNEKAGKRFRESDPHIKLIEARLKSGVTPEDCCRVIITKVDDWLKSDNPKFASLRYATPDTLFNPTKFEKYFAEAKQRFRGFYHGES